MKRNMLQILFALVATIGLCTTAFALPCPWSISTISVEKWGNGNIKSAMRASGSFPISTGMERPTWYVNDNDVGKADVFFQLRTVYGGAQLRDKAVNTVVVKFSKAPYAGATSTLRFYFDADRVPPGGSATFGATLQEKEVLGETLDGRQSDNLLLHLPDELRSGAIPASAPTMIGVGNPTAKVTMVTVDLASRSVQEIPQDSFSSGRGNEYEEIAHSFGSGLSVSSERSLNAGGAAKRPEVVIGSDDRVRDKDPMHFPEHTIVKIYSKYPQSSDKYMCSGAMIGDRFVLTAAHCVYDKKIGGWATSVQVIPALQGSYMPYGSANAVKMMSFDLYLNNADERHDLAVLKIDKPLGNSTGWMGRRTAGSGDAMYARVHIVEGYPWDKDSGLKMWWDQKKDGYADEYLLRYQMDTEGGQSGSPVWSWPNNYAEGPWFITAVHRGGTPSYNQGVRLNRVKFDAISNFVASGRLLVGGPDDERAQLIDDGQAYSGFTPTTLPVAGGGFSVWTGVRNIGTKAIDSYTVSFYASRDTTITRSDHLLGTITGSRLEPFAYEDIAWSGSLPPGMAEGDYYIGWIVSVPDETDIASYKKLYQLHVSNLARFSVNGPPEAPELLSPRQGETVPAGEIVFTWKKSTDPDGNPVSYRVQYCKNASFTGCFPVDVDAASTKGAPFQAALAFPLLLGLFAMVLSGGGSNGKRRILCVIFVVAVCFALSLNACSSSSTNTTEENASVMTQRVQGLDRGSVYYWKVIADDGQGGSSESVTVGFQTE